MEHTFENFNLEPQTTIALRWEKWINRFDIFLVARNINNGERKKAMLLHSAGEEVYDVYDSLQIPAESTYDQFKTLLSEYFAPKRNMQYERYVFRNESQSASQAIDSYYTKLKGLAKHCEFADIDGEIFSQIIQRCSDNHVREKGLSEPNLSLQNLLLYARSRESVRHHSNMMTAPTVTTPHPTPRPAQNPEGVEQELQITSGVDAMVPTGGGDRQPTDQSTRINNKLGHADIVEVNRTHMADDTTVQHTTRFVMHVELWDISHRCADVGETTNSLERAIIIITQDVATTRTIW